MLDTDACIHLLNRKRPKLIRRVLAHRAADFIISTITVAELSYGVAKSTRPQMNAKKLAVLRSQISTAPFDERAAEIYGTIRADLERRGVPIGPHDMLIAAHALSIGVTLVSSNTKEFRRVKGLLAENWAV
jgi:tRNA(fMet)-specific endonuclease VapC